MTAISVTQNVYHAQLHSQMMERIIISRQL